MSETHEMSKTTTERIESVFDEFVVKKIVGELDPIKSDLKRSDNSYQDRTTRECVENICRSVGEIEDSLGRIKKSVLKQQDPKWKMSEQIQALVDWTDDENENWEERHNNLAAHIDTECANIKNDLADKMQAHFTATSADRCQQTETILEQVAALMSTTNQSSLDFRTTLEETHKKSTEMLVSLINERGIQLQKNEDANASTLRASIETHTFKTIESVQKIGTDVQKAQADNHKQVKAAIGTLTEIAREVSQRQDSHHAELVAQVEAFEASNARKLDEFVSLCKNENQHLKRMLYISWAIGGTTLAATIASILIQLL